MQCQITVDGGKDKKAKEVATLLESVIAEYMWKNADKFVGMENEAMNLKVVFGNRAIDTNVGEVS
jgi:hypothetical protein